MSEVIKINSIVQKKVGKFFENNFKEDDLEEYSIHYIKRMIMEYFGDNK